MAKTVSEEEIQLRKRARRRLVGAITLVISAVVILPMVLDREPKQGSQEIDIRIPSEKSAGEFTPKAVPGIAAPVTAAPEKPAPVAQQAESTKPVPQVQPSPVAEKPMEKPAEKPAEKPVGKKPEPKAEPKAEPKVDKPAANVDAFVVQLGAFSDPAKARHRQQSLASNGIKAYTEILKTDKGEMTRVRAGPFPTREAAEETREKLKKLGLDGVVTNK